MSRFYASIASRRFCLRSILLAWTALVLSTASDAQREDFSLVHGARVVLLCDGLTSRALKDPIYPSLARLARRGALGLVALPVAGQSSRTSAALSLAAGIPSQGRALDRAAYRAEEQVEGARAWQVLLRRTGIVPPVRDAVVHLGIASLDRRGVAANLPMANAFGARGAIIAPLELGASETERLAALFSIDARGIAPAAPKSSVDIIIYHVGGDRALLEARLSRALRSAGAIWVIGTRILRDRNAYAARPALTVMAGPGVRRGLLTSRTTRTPGLISFADVRPTLLGWLGLKPQPGWQGSPVTALRNDQPLDAIVKLDTMAATNVRAMVPGLSILGLLVGIGGAIAFSAAAGYRAAITPARLALAWAMSLPSALLLTGWLTEFVLMRAVHGRPVPAAMMVMAVMAAAGLIATAVLSGVSLSFHPTDIRRRTLYEISAFLAIICSLVLIDSVTGQRLLRTSLLAACGMSGIRFYGIGNEYMGLTVAAGLGLGHLGLRSSWSRVAATALAALVFGLGSIGANAGGVITAVSAFGMAAAIRGDRPLRWQAALGLPLLGIVAVFAFAIADRQLSGASSSHLGRAIGDASTSGPGVLLSIASRKLMMNAGILTQWPAIVSAGALMAAVFLARARMQDRLQALDHAIPPWREWRTTTYMAAITAFLFNDTGVVSALLIVAVFVICGLYLAIPAVGGDEAIRSADAGLVE